MTCLKYHIVIILTGIFLFLSNLLVAQNSYNRQIVIKHKTLEHEDDSLRIELILDFRKINIESGQSLTLVPVIKTEKKSKLLPSIVINGKNKHKVYNRMLALNNKKVNTIYEAIEYDFKTNFVYAYTISVPYESWMKNSRLLVTEEQCGCINSPKIIITDQVSENIEKEIVPQKKIKTPVSFITPEVEPVKQRKYEGEAYLEYPTGETTIYPHYRNNSYELGKIQSLLQRIIGNEDTRILGITIVGYASPEGSYAHNMELSRKRANSLKTYLQFLYRFDDDIFKVIGMSEDWTKLEMLVRESDMKEKNIILSIINNTDIFDGREKRIMDLDGGKPYREMVRTIFPKLRRCVYTLNYMTLPYDIEKSRRIFQSRPECMSLNEMFLLAQTYDVNNLEFKRILEKAAEIFPNDEVANLNAAAVSLIHSDIEQAEIYLKKVKKNTPEYMNNMGLLYMMKGDLANARQLFSKSAEKGVKEAEHNLSEIANFY